MPETLQQAIEPDDAYAVGEPDDAIDLEEGPWANGLVSRLAMFIDDRFNEAKDHRAREGVDERLNACMRQYLGEYDETTLQQIQHQGGSQVFRKLTQYKSEAAAAWIEDIMSFAAQKPWSFAPTPISDLPPELVHQIAMQAANEAMAEIAQLQATGQINTLEEAQQIAFQLAAQKRQEITLEMDRQAKERAQKMEETCDDQVTEGGFEEAFRSFVQDYVVFPNAFLKGPFVQMTEVLEWEGPKPVSRTVPKLVWESISPYDMFPSPGARDIQDGYLIERSQITRHELASLRHVEGYDSERIETILRGQPETSWTAGDAEGDSDRADMEGQPLPGEEKEDRTYEMLLYWGYVDGETLNDWGLDAEDPLDEYSICAVKVGRYVIKAMMNPDPLNQRPYSMDSWRSVNRSFWGMSLPETMEDIQSQCNSSVRAMDNNLALSSGPFMSVDVAALPNGQQELPKISPYYVHQYDSEKTPHGSDGVGFKVIPCNAQQYMRAYQEYKKEADDVTGVPSFVHGSGETSGAGETASGLSMLMSTASRGMKRSIARLGQRILATSLYRLFVWNMMNNPDESIKGDIRIEPKGALAALAREQTQTIRRQFLLDTNNPTDMAIIGLDRRRNLLAERARDLDMPEEDVVPDADELRRRLVMQQQAAMQGEPNGNGRQEKERASDDGGVRQTA